MTAATAEAEPGSKLKVQPSETSQRPPLVSGILVFSGPAGRVGLAQRRVDQMLDQTYPNVELVIINASGVPITNRTHGRVIEIPIPSGDYTIAELRNKAVKACRGEYVVSWDDDDVSHPHRIALQMATLAGSKAEATVLTHQLRLDVSALNSPDRPAESRELSSTLVLRERLAGESSTMIWKREDDRGNVRLFDKEQKIGELDSFMERHFPPSKRVVYENSENKPNGFPSFPALVLHVAFYHGINASTRDQFLDEYAGDEYRNLYVPRLDERSEEYIADMGERMGLSIRKTVAETTA